MDWPVTVTLGVANTPVLTNDTAMPEPASPIALDVNRTLATPLVFKSEIAVAVASDRTGAIGVVSRVPIRSRNVLDGTVGPGSKSRSFAKTNVAVFADAL